MTDEQMEQLHEQLIGENAELIGEGVSVGPVLMLKLRLDVLADLVAPEGSRSRLALEVGYEHQLNAALKHTAETAMREVLTEGTPAAGGLHVVRS